ncbi:MAG: hypothetical protein MUC92_08405 [Fimbriimonadaceae bacterium]|jgi:prophage maintenance system killer protein|nr:hypothetical protein [Fimbriimonadaceae bacterium]
MSSLHFLTVPDMLWINLQITKKSHRYNFATLEEATFLQYSYGASGDLLSQAIRFLSDFPKLKPFVHGNQACAFVGFASFLLMNGKQLTLSDQEAGEFLKELVKSKDVAFLESKLQEAHLHGRLGAPDSQEAAKMVMAQFPHTCSELLNGERPAILA